MQYALQPSAVWNEVCNLCTLFILHCAAVWSVCKVQCGRGMGALYNRNILTMRSNWERLKSHSLLHCLCWLYQRRSQGNKSQSNPDTRMVYKGFDLHLILIATPMRFHDSPVLFLLQYDSRWDHQPILLALGNTQWVLTVLPTLWIVNMVQGSFNDCNKIFPSFWPPNRF